LRASISDVVSSSVFAGEIGALGSFSGGSVDATGLTGCGVDGRVGLRIGVLALLEMLDVDTGAVLLGGGITGRVEGGLTGEVRVGGAEGGVTELNLSGRLVGGLGCLMVVEEEGILCCVEAILFSNTVKRSIIGLSCSLLIEVGAELTGMDSIFPLS